MAMENWPRPGPVDQLGQKVRIPGQAWGTNDGRDWGQDVGTRAWDRALDKAGTRLGTGQGPTGTWELSKNQGTNVRTGKLAKTWASGPTGTKRQNSWPGLG